MTGISIIVPHTGQIERFEDTLASVLRHRPSNSQLIVVHDGSYDDPYDLSGEVHFVDADQSYDLIPFLNVGMCYVGGETTVIMRPGIEVDENWDGSISEAFEDGRVGAVSPVIVGAKRQSKVVASGVDVSRSGSRKLVGSGKRLSGRRLRSIKSVGPSSWFAAYRTRLLKQLLPFDEQLDPICWDADVASAIKAMGFQNQLASDCIAIAESEDIVLEETGVAHGLSAQRSLARAGKASLSATVGGLVGDLFGSAIQPWKLRHLVQRLGAGKYRNIDESHFEQLQQLRKKQLWLEQKEPESEQPAEFSYRRAA